jgi:hypothetical protein
MCGMKYTWIVVLLSVFVVPLLSCAKDDEEIKLPSPQMQ